MKTYRLEEIVKISSSKRIKMNEYVSSGIPFFRSKEIINLHKNQKIQTELFISEERFNEIDEKFGSPSPGDILLTSVGTLGIPYQVKAGDKFYFKDGNLTWFKNYSENVNQKYLYYWLTSQTAKRKFDEITIGSTQKALTIISLKGIEIDLPSLNVQDDVVAVIDSIQTKIELNQKMNETLEEIAKTLFKSWFIDFDPVRAKAEGRPTGLSKEISDLFPDSFEDSELGEIPSGWKISNFGNFTQPVRGKVITKKTTLPGNIPVVAGGLEPAYFHAYSNTTGPVVTISASGKNAGYVNLFYEDIWASDCSYISNEQSDYIYTSYLFLKINQQKIFDSQHGAAQPHINPDDLMRLEMAITPSSLTEAFEEMVASFYKKIAINKLEIGTLKKIRDTLLPRLISGELRIPDAEKLVEEVGV